MRWIVAMVVGLACAGLMAGCSAAPSSSDLRAQATLSAAQSQIADHRAREIDALATLQAAQTATAWARATELARPTSTPTPQPTATALPTAAPTVPPQPTATPQPTPEFTGTPVPEHKARTIYDDWPLLFMLGIGALAVVMLAWRLIDGKTITLPGRGRNDDA